MSNPDARYKSYFRDAYSAFALASDTELKKIRKDILSEHYEPDHASKVMIPKPSGVFRPLTLLSVSDQVVYQSIINVVSEQLKPITRKRYKTRVYAHLYAGKSSKFFYLKWQDSYKQFGQRVRVLHKNGYKHVANFDLASFYDSIDHYVLTQFLEEIHIEEKVIRLLMKLLRKWTSSTWGGGSGSIYHEHGIPQGPLSSGMLSEVLLQHIDKAGERGRMTVYLRYVDDIKIFAKSEIELRRKILALDLASKEIGLFPQTSKINIRKFTDPEKEIKSVSRPVERSVYPVVNQKRLVSRLLELTRRGRVKAEFSTRFKYLLGQCSPTYRLNERLLKVIVNQPEYAPSISLY